MRHRSETVHVCLSRGQNYYVYLRLAWLLHFERSMAWRFQSCVATVLATAVHQQAVFLARSSSACAVGGNVTLAVGSTALGFAKTLKPRKLCQLKKPLPRTARENGSMFLLLPVLAVTLVYMLLGCLRPRGQWQLWKELACCLWFFKCLKQCSARSVTTILVVATCVAMAVKHPLRLLPKLNVLRP